MTLTIEGLRSKLIITRGLGSQDSEPPPTPPSGPDSILGDKVGGVIGSTTATVLGTEIY